MDISDEDEDLKRAIALSLQEQESQSIADKEVINLDTDSEGGIPNASVTIPSSSAPVPMSYTLLGLDRKAMEQERLARKRKASISPPPSRKAMKESDSSTTLPSYPTLTQNLNPNNALGGPLYLDGMVKKTNLFGCERKDDIKIEEVLQRDQLNLAVLSSFQWDIAWLFKKLNTATTKLYLVMQAKDDATKRQYEKETSRMANLRLCFPPMEGQVGCMHSKLMLLSYPTHLRVVVPTANLVPFDWGETGAMENMVFLVDLPRQPNDRTTPTTELTAFGQDLVYFLQSMGLEDSVVQSVHKFDFSKTKDFAFVHTIGGAHIENEAWGRTGYCGLGRAVRELGLDTRKSLNIDFVTSSVGSLTIGFLTTLYLAAQGDDGLTEYDWRNSKKTKAKTSGADKEAREFRDRVENDVNKYFHIYFPTDNSILDSSGGTRNGGTICFQSKWYDAPNFPQQLLRDCKAEGERRVLMHHKILLVRQKEQTPQDVTNNSGSSAWAYIGSANCSESAWGKLIKDRVSKVPKLNCRNWECGVVVPMRSLQQDSGGGSGSEIIQPLYSTDQHRSLQEFVGRIPIPMQYPGEEYGTRRPWFYSESPYVVR